MFVFPPGPQSLLNLQVRKSLLIFFGEKFKNREIIKITGNFRILDTPFIINFFVTFLGLDTSEFVAIDQNQVHVLVES